MTSGITDTAEGSDRVCNMNNGHFCKDCKQNFEDSEAMDVHLVQCLLINGIDG